MISERREVPPGPGGESGIPSAPASGDLTEGAFLEAVPVERFSLGDVEGETSRYRLGRLLGEGGMGSVFEAEQLAPVRRQVAIKLIKLGMDTRQVVARFRAERQALAMMEHPGIARVFDAGATATGRPFYAMELVDGEPITRYCDRLRFTLRQRLALFATVCDAVQHAHQKGIIHRDLKAGNVLVTGPAGAPMAKVIDFGIARAISDLPGVAGLTLAPTQQGADGLAGGAVPEGAIGTPESMSPEQALGNAAAVDTRTDVYALGVLLYELLSG